jgi:hypothetical protein
MKRPVKIKSLSELKELWNLYLYPANKFPSTRSIDKNLFEDWVRSIDDGPSTFQYAVKLGATPTTAATVTDDLAYLTIKKPFTVTAISTSAFTAPTGSVLRVRVQVNGTGLSGTINMSAGDLESNNIVIPTERWEIGDIITFDITQIGSILPGEGVIVYISGILG